MALRSICASNSAPESPTCWRNSAKIAARSSRSNRKGVDAGAFIDAEKCARPSAGGKLLFANLGPRPAAAISKEPSDHKPRCGAVAHRGIAPVPDGYFCFQEGCEPQPTRGSRVVGARTRPKVDRTQVVAGKGERVSLVPIAAAAHLGDRDVFDVVPPGTPAMASGRLHATAGIRPEDREDCGAITTSGPRPNRSITRANLRSRTSAGQGDRARCDRLACSLRGFELDTTFRPGAPPRFKILPGAEAIERDHLRSYVGKSICTRTVRGPMPAK